MIFTYKPEGAPERKWEVKTGRLLSPEMEAIEKVTGQFYPTWNASLLDGSASAARALLWVLLKRENPVLKYDEVLFSYDEFDLEYDLDEKAGIVANYDEAIAAGAPEPGPAFAALIEAYRADLPVVEAPVEDKSLDLDSLEDPEGHVPEAPKASSPAPSSESSTSGSSPVISGAFPLTSTV